MYQHYLNPFLIKQQLKSVDLSPQSYFLLTTSHVCPMAIPEILAQTQVSDYWQLIHWLTQNEWNKILVHISSVLF